MEYSDFSKIIEQAKGLARKMTMVVAAAEDEEVVESALHAKRSGICDVIFSGDAAEIRAVLGRLGASPGAENIIAAAPGSAGQTAVDLVRDGSADFIMKGRMETRDILRPVVKKENGLRLGRVMSHFALNELPGYHKLIVNTDGGMMIYPTLAEKKGIIENAVSTLRAMGYALPKVAALAGIEKVDPKMRETVEAAELMRMCAAGGITGCVVEGPLSYDVAMSAEIARDKKVEYAHCGDYDVLLQPFLAAGNIMGKCWSVTVGARMAGIIVGARVPVAVVSRSAPADEKYNAIALAAVVAAGMGG